MASSVFFLLVLHFLLTMNGAAAIPDEELDAMFPALRSSGYSRIGNTIATSDLSLDFVSAETLTLFAPSDASLFALDMELEAASYVSALRSHVVPRRLSISDLRLLPGPFVLLPTLLPDRSLNITVRREDRATTIIVNGMRLISPGLYYGSHMVVHGLAGSLTASSPSEGTPPTYPEVVDSPFNYDTAASNLFFNSPPPPLPTPPVEAQAILPPTDPPVQIQPALPPAASPVQVQATLSPATTSMVITDPNSLWPEIGEGDDPPPQLTAQLPEIGDAVFRRRPTVTRPRRRLSRVQLPASMRRGKVNRHLKRQERATAAEAAETILPLKEMITMEPHLRQTLLERYHSTNPYGFWSDPLCEDECGCLHC